MLNAECSPWHPRYHRVPFPALRDRDVNPKSVPKIRHRRVSVFLHAQLLQPLFAQQLCVLAAILYAVDPSLRPSAERFRSLGLSVILLEKSVVTLIVALNRRWM